MTIIDVTPDPVPAGQTAVIRFTGGPANGASSNPPGVPIVLGKGTVTVGPFPGPGAYQITITNDANQSVSTTIDAQ